MSMDETMLFVPLYERFILYSCIYICIQGYEYVKQTKVIYDCRILFTNLQLYNNMLTFYCHNSPKRVNLYPCYIQ